MFSVLTGIGDSQPWLHPTYTSRQIRTVVYGAVIFTVGVCLLVKELRPRNHGVYK